MTLKFALVLYAVIAVLNALAAPTHAQIVSSGVYTVVSKASGLALDNEGSTSAGNGVWQWSSVAGSTNQMWQINRLPSGNYTMVCLTSGMTLDSGNRFPNGSLPIQNTSVPQNIDQEWIVTQLANGSCTFVNAANGLALDNSGATANGGTVRQSTPASGSANQQWQVTLVKQLPIASGGIYTLTCRKSGLNLDNEGASAAGNQVWQYGGGLANTNQEWRITVLPGGQYSLTCVTSGMNLDNAGSTANGTAITQNYPQPGSSTNQQWTIASAGGAYCTLVCQKSGKALDNGGSTLSNAPIQQAAVVSGSANQQWTITPVQIGANTPFITYEAESGALAGSAHVTALTTAPTTMFSSPELEASGHAYVNLANAGDSVTWTNNTGKSITAINVRYSIPDSAGGGGNTSTLNLYVNGTFRQALPVSSTQTWVYETSGNYNGMSQSPSSGNAHVFWDETHAFVSGAAIAPGSTITLQKTSSNTAAYYNIDAIDLEAPPAALTQPANSLSIASYGATPNNSSFDNSTAIQNCINAAQSQGKSVWIPQGVYYVFSGSPLTATGITISGAGPWYSTVICTASNWSNGFIFLTHSASFQNLSIDASGPNATPGLFAILAYDDNWSLNNVWTRHTMLTWADGSNITISNCRVNNSWGDGVNINNINGNACNNVTITNNFSRGNGDDGMALNSSNSSAPVMTGILICNNTCVAEWWANNIGIYGGVNVFVNNNLVTDSVKEFGISVGLYSGSAHLQTAYIQGNAVLRGGSNGWNLQYPAMGIGVSGNSSNINGVSVTGNMLANSPFDGVHISSGSSLYVAGNLITTPGLNGFEVDSGATGNAFLICNSVANLKSGQTAYIDNAPASNFTVTGSGNIGFTVP
ncbi:hypothetical protein CCAX7_36420 [Capsulimonas corticalis]|uniref:Uncharacterized protein n=1 Tax=Capsulimonas corticalis TaxID=2219043 RepID=A0A402D6V4_9BACT|nr:RICIN domain-containing protein [Capsulimonas corticalis]BDI31591.1 hypothetical protein CCAX7_36420 [Capsulimonas corticalis]